MSLNICTCFINFSYLLSLLLSLLLLLFQKEIHTTEILVPEQIHLSLGANSSQLWITWMTFSNETPPKPMVDFQPEQIPKDQFAFRSVGLSRFFWNENRPSWIHRVELSNLLSKTIYFYKAGFINSWSSIQKYKTIPSQNEEWFPRLAIFGDLGLENGISIPYLQTVSSQYDAILHVGDIAYDLISNNGKVGDDFFNKMQTAMTSTLYQVVPGNHESWNNFSQYDARFTMIDQHTEQMNNHFYSFNLGPLHIVGFNSEFYYWYYDNPVRNLQQTRIQYEWLEEDLRRASIAENRRKQPWIIVMGHRPMYCSTAGKDDCIFNECILKKGIPIVERFGLENLFYKYRVDIIIAGHEHTYERLFPVYDRRVYNGTNPQNPYENAQAPIHLLVGSGGCQETIDSFIQNPMPWSAKRISDYGITDFKVLNRTHIEVKQRSTTKHGKVVDKFMIVKT